VFAYFDITKLWRNILNIYKFTEEKDESKEYKHKILVYPNITFSKNLEKDSYVVVLANTIREVNKIKKDVFWTILTPEYMRCLDYENTEQVMLRIPTYPNKMRTHFNADEIIKVLDWRGQDYDVVYSHLPEQTLALKNLFMNSTNIHPIFVGYSHWFEVKQNSNYDTTMLNQNLLGILEMDECGVNSAWLKDFILEKSKDLFNDKQLKLLRDKIQPHYLGIDNLSTKHQYDKKTILFNHRDNGYTGFKWFVKQMDKLYEKRQDFKVLTTISKINRPYAKRVEITNRQDYLKFIRRMHMGVGCFKTYSAWSISTTDGLSQGVPYVLPNKLCYPEMVGDDYPLLYEETNFLDKIEQMLDNPTMRDDVNKHLEPKLRNFPWHGRIKKWFDGWNFDSKEIGETEAYKKILNFIKTKESVTKRDIIKYMNWGIRISFTPYRNRLRKEKDIKLTRIGYEVIK